MEIMLLIVLALFLLSGLDKYWSPRAATSAQKKARRLPPRTLPQRRPRRSAEGSQAVWRRPAATPNSMAEARWRWQ